jgi:toxin CcdB
MACFDVYAHPDAQLRKTTPFLLDVQNEFLENLATRVVIPMRAASLFPLRARDLNPVFTIDGKEVVLDTAAIAAFPSSHLKRPTLNLKTDAAAVTGALDTLFGSY